jgi:hypothetical protein
MVNASGVRELAYLVTVDEVCPIVGRDRVECAVIGGWKCMVPKNQFQAGSLGIYFEIDSKVDTTQPAFAFLEKRKGVVKTQRYRNSDGSLFYSQGLLMHPADFGWAVEGDKVILPDGTALVKGDFLTARLGVTYADADDQARKTRTADPEAKYRAMAQRNQKLFKRKPFRWLMRREWGKKLLFVFFGKKKDRVPTHFPKQFEYVHPTDQERVENMVTVLKDKTPYIVTQKCDGSSGTFILSRKKFGKFEFFVCSRNVRQLRPDQQCFYETNYYWEVAKKYDIESKLTDYLKKHPDINYICWQGEICAPKIQKNPHRLSETHFYAFHMIDSKIGKWDIREAKKIWDSYGIESVPIVNENYILPDDFEEFKASADTTYDPAVCEGKSGCAAEGYVYYKTTDPSFSFKNVSRTYLLNH